MTSALRKDGQDDSRAQRSARLLASQKQALEQAVSGVPLADVLTLLAEAAATHLGGRAAILLSDAPGKKLWLRAAAGLPPTYTEAIDGFPIGLHVPSCGTAAHTGMQVIIPDVHADPLCAPYLDLLAAHGIRACWATPLRGSGDRTLGVLTTYFDAPRTADPDERDALDLLAHTAALLVARYKAEEEREEREHLLTTVIDSLPVGVAVIGKDGRLIRTNTAMHRYISDNIPSTDPRVAPRWQAMDADGSRLEATDFPGARALRGEHVVPGIDFRFQRSADEEVWTRVMAVPLHSRNGQITGAISAIIDIDAEKRAEQDLRTALEQARRNALVAHEMGHRVMNSFQLLQGLLTLQARTIADSQARAVVETTVDRIQSMALVHRRLFEATRNDLGPVDLGLYLRVLTEDLLAAVAPDGTCRASVVAAEGLRLEAGRASAIGLLTTELLLNALKHAFPDGRTGQLSVRLEAVPAGLRLTVADDGIGLPDARGSGVRTGMGMTLVRGLTAQVQGTLETEDAVPGTRFILTFPA
ncbi:sensor histidine kinase [Oleisolibacter albus]|uniref:sensor histidine kinase n=1 Tax=Oleisolibacter albus TaxID=2171757 RepID=UPI000DF2E794|nr:GAF domain-containing protein [Oleisolibacter albus]